MFKSFKPIDLICDAGTENTNILIRRLCKKNDVNLKIRTKKNKAQNNTIEAFFNILKSRYMNKYKRYTHEDLKLKISLAINKYNASPIASFFGANANEVFSMKVDYNFLNRDFKQKLEYARIKRIKQFKNEVHHSRASGS
jgi:transposase InsO family protein